MHSSLASVSRSCSPRQPLRLLLSAVLVASLWGCGGGGGDAEPDAPTGGGGGTTAPDVTALAGTYALKTGATVVGSFMLDQSASVTVCTVGSDRGCTAQVTAPTAANPATRFKLAGDAAGSTASGTIAADGAVSGQLTKASGAVEAFTGSKVSATFSDCQAPFTRVDGQCTPPASGIALAPSIVWLEELAQNGRMYTMQLCYSPLGLDCTPISERLFVSSEDLADEETADIMDYAFSVAREFQAMIGRLWAAKTYPTHAQLVQIFRNAVDQAIEADAQTAVQTAGAGFASAGFPAAAGGSSSTPSTPSGTASSAESVCATQSYPGDTSEPQAYLFDKLAQFDACMYRATNNSDYVTDGNMQCRVLNGLLQATVGTFTPLYCNGAQLKQ